MDLKERMRSIGREVVLFTACAIFVGTVGLIVVDTVIMPRYVRKGQHVEVPSLRDLTPDQARRALARKGLRLKLKESRWDPEILEGHIVYQSPAALSGVKQGRTVYATPSKGQRSFSVPNLIKKPLRQANLLVQQSSLIVGSIDEEPSEDVPDGSVIGQSPEPGIRVAGGTEMALVISNGPPGELIVMPDLVGKSIRNAREILDEALLKVQQIRYEFTTSYEPNLVIRHEPAAGDSIRQGSKVSIVISRL